MKKHLVSWTAVTATVVTWAPPALAEDGASNFDGRPWGMVAAGLAGKLFVPMILALAMIESLVIYALVISLRILGMLG